MDNVLNLLFEGKGDNRYRLDFFSKENGDFTYYGEIKDIGENFISLFLSPNNSKKDIKVRNAVLRITQLEKEIIALKTSNNSQDNNSVQDDTNSKEENA